MKQDENKGWICFFFGHKYRLAQTLSEHSRRVCCTRCHQSFAMNDDVKVLIPWDACFHRMYEHHGIKITYLPLEFK